MDGCVLLMTNRDYSGDEKPLRILHLASHTGVSGGGSVQMARMARGLKARGHEVVVAFNAPSLRRGKSRNAETFGGLPEAGIECEVFSMQSGLAAMLGETRRFRKFLQARDFDIIHAHKARALRFALENIGATGASTRAPMVVAQRGNSSPLDAHTRALMNEARVGAVVCVAQEVRKLVIDGGVAAEKVVAIYGGVDPEEFDFRLDGNEVRRELGIAPETPLVGLIANYDAKKAHDAFLRACVLLREKVPNVRVLLVGRGLPPQLSETIRALDLEKCVTPIGFRGDVPRVLAALDVSVNFSSGGEGLTGALRESLCMKVPVAGTDVGGNRELVRDGETGFIVPAGDDKTFAARIAQLLENRELAARLAQNGYDLVMREFTETVRIARLEELYRRLRKP